MRTQRIIFLSVVAILIIVGVIAFNMVGGGTFLGAKNSQNHGINQNISEPVDESYGEIQVVPYPQPAPAPSPTVTPSGVTNKQPIKRIVYTYNYVITRNNSNYAEDNSWNEFIDNTVNDNDCIDDKDILDDKDLIDDKDILEDNDLVDDKDIIDGKDDSDIIDDKDLIDDVDVDVDIEETSTETTTENSNNTQDVETSEPQETISNNE